MIGGIIFARSELEKKLEKGKNVEIEVIFMRHGERNNEGNLTEYGKEQNHEYGKKLSGTSKGYSSPTQRVIDSIDNVVDSSKGRKLKTRIRKELAEQEMSQEFLDAYDKNPSRILNKWYHNKNWKFDKGTETSHSVARRFAYLLDHYIKMSERLYEGSKVNLINGTHECLPEVLLNEIMISYQNGKRIRGFKKIEDIGGTLKYGEGIKFKIIRNKKGQDNIELDFRGKRYEVDREKLSGLAKDYKKD